MNQNGGFRFSKNFWFLVKISRGEMPVFSPQRVPMKVAHRISLKNKMSMKKISHDLATLVSCQMGLDLLSQRGQSVHSCTNFFAIIIPFFLQYSNSHLYFCFKSYFFKPSNSPVRIDSKSAAELSKQFPQKLFKCCLERQHQPVLRKALVGAEAKHRIFAETSYLNEELHFCFFHRFPRCFTSLKVALSSFC